MNPAQLFQQHKTAVLAAAAAGVAGLALLHRRQAGGGDTSAAASQATSPAAAIVPGGGSYDSSAYDVYNAMQSQFGAILDQARQANSVPAAPAPASSNLLNGYKPGLYRRTGTSQVFQLNSDGTLDYLTLNEHMPLIKAGQKVQNVSKDNTFWQRTYLDPAGTFKNWTTALKPPGRTT